MCLFVHFFYWIWCRSVDAQFWGSFLSFTANIITCWYRKGLIHMNFLIFIGRKSDSYYPIYIRLCTVVNHTHTTVLPATDHRICPCLLLTTNTNALSVIREHTLYRCKINRFLSGKVDPLSILRIWLLLVWGFIVFRRKQCVFRQDSLTTHLSVCLKINNFHAVLKLSFIKLSFKN